MKRVVIVADAQVPYANIAQVEALANFIKSHKPDDVYCVGDVADLPMVSRWTRGRRGEFDTDITVHRDEVKRFLEKVMPNGGHLKEGNHDRRVEMYVDQYAPALSPLKELKMENFFGLADLGVTLHRELWEFAPGVVLAHGDEAGIASVGGETARKLGTKLNKSVICSHTHRQGLIFQGHSMLGVQGDTHFFMEVGHTMNLSDAKYLSSGAANWTPGFGVIDIEDGKVTPQLVQMSQSGDFTFERKKYVRGRVQRTTK